MEAFRGPLPGKTVNPKQYHSPEAIAEISVTAIQDLKDWKM